MRKIKEVLRLKLDAKLSHGQIAAALHLSKGVVTKYVGLAAAAGLDWSVIQLLDDVTLERRLLAGPEKPRLPYTATGVLKTTGPAQAKFPAPCQSSGDAIPVMEAMHPVGERHWHLGPSAQHRPTALGTKHHTPIEQAPKPTQLFSCGLVRQSPRHRPHKHRHACGIRSTHGVCEERIRHHRARNKTGPSANCYPKERPWPRNNASSPTVYCVRLGCGGTRDCVMKSALVLDLIAGGDS